MIEAQRRNKKKSAGVWGCYERGRVLAGRGGGKKKEEEDEEDEEKERTNKRAQNKEHHR